MALVPKCPFRVNLYSRLGDHLRMEHHNYETLPGAMSYRDALLTRPRTTRVEVLMVLDESTPTHKEPADAYLPFELSSLVRKL